MKELIRNPYGSSVSYTHTGSYVTLSYSITDLDSGDFVYGGVAASVSSQGGGGNNQVWTYRADIPSAYCQYDREMRIVFSHTGSVSNIEAVDYKFYTPYATTSRMSEVFDTTPYTTAKLLRTEALVRNSINSFVGYDFAPRYKTLIGYGNNSDTLVLPERIMSVSKIYEDDVVVYDPSNSIDTLGASFEISASRRRLRILGDVDTEVFESQEVSIFNYNGIFKNNVQYKVEGVYGWDYVPSDIEDAAILLVEEYLCNDSSIRNKGVKSFKNESYQLQFADGVGNSTGNLVADNLLSKYRYINVTAI